MSRAILLIPFWTFVACYRATFTITFTFTAHSSNYKEAFTPHTFHNTVCLPAVSFYAAGMTREQH